MKFPEFMKTLDKNSSQIFLLGGEERYFIDRAKSKILEKIFPDKSEIEVGLTRVDDMNPADLIITAQTVPFFSSQIAILLEHTTLFKDSDFKDKSIDRLVKFFEKIPTSTFIIFVTDSKPDKRKKIYKAVDKFGAILESDPLRPWEIEPWFNEKIRELNLNFNKDAREYFLSAIAGLDPISLNFLSGELEKLPLFIEGNLVTRENLEEIFSTLPEISNFALNEEISKKNANRAIELLRRQIHDGVFLPLIVGMLAKYVRQLIQTKIWVKRGTRGKNLGKPLEMNPYVAEKLGQTSEKFEMQTLEDSYLKLCDADYLFKTGGAGAELLEEVVLKLCR